MNTLERLQQHLAGEVEPVGSAGRLYKRVAPQLACVDGSTMSVQASETHYCTPRDNSGPYTHVEVWCCGTVPAWYEYGDGDDLYAYVPTELVVEEIDRRGGLKEKQA